MRRSMAVVVVTVFLAGTVLGGFVRPAIADDLIFQAIKVFGIGYVVKQYGSQIDSFINSLMQNNHAPNNQKTKVVPILSVGVGIVSSNPGSYIGAAQVMGPAAAVAKVEAVAQVEGTFLDALRVKGLVPVDSLNPVAGNLHRVYGVGITALIDVKI